VYATKAPVDRIILPRSLVGRRRVYTCSWRYEVGQLMKLGMLPAVISARRRTAMGRELYTLEIIGEDYGRRTRQIFGNALALEPWGAHEQESEQIPTLKAV